MTNNIFKKPLWFATVMMAALFSSYTSAVQAADIIHDSKQGKIRLTGEIKKGDYNQALHLLRQNPVEFLHSTWYLDSRGGDIEEAMRLATLVRSLYQPVIVSGPTGREICSNACAYIFLSAINRHAPPKTVGISQPHYHSRYSPVLSFGHAEVRHARLQANAKQYLHEVGVEHDIIKRMFSLSEGEIYWLDRNELNNKVGMRPAWFEKLVEAECGFNNKQFLRTKAEAPSSAAAKEKMGQWVQCEKQLSLSRGIVNARNYLGTDLQLVQEAQPLNENQR